MRVLVADDDQISRKVVKALLSKWGYEVVEAENGTQAWYILQESDSPRLVVMDWMMPGLDGLEICRRLRDAGNRTYHYIILLTSRDSKEDIIGGLNAGADDYITKPFFHQELEVRLRVGGRILNLQESLEEALQMQRYQAQYDPLTNIFNHGEILSVLEREIERGKRENTSLAVMMGDIDHFKKVNDNYGHVAGDAVLAEIADRLKTSVRIYDTVGRYGGEEFLFILPACSAPEAVSVAQRILAVVQDSPVSFQEEQIQVTISLGLAVIGKGQDIGLIDIVQAADAALYQAKQNGRNRLEAADR